jgi:hypothetical protein
LASELATQNVVALLPGRDSALRGQYVVIGAHYDHLGRSTFGAMDPEAGDAIRNGADDNASGTAAVLELARLLVRRPLRRPVLFVAFSGEELGLLGSQSFVEHMPMAADSVQAMLNFDMVGRLEQDALIVSGVATASEWRAIVERANAEPPLRLSMNGDGFGASDQSSFYAAGIPVLHFFTNIHDDYHKATDDAEKIHAAGEARVVGLAVRVARDIGDRGPRLTVQRSAAPANTMGPRAGSSVYLGSVPDMASGSGDGLRLSAVRPGSPADLAGLAAGDVVIELGGVRIHDLYQYSDALYSHHPGEPIEIVVLRGGARKVHTATLGSR